MSAVRLKRLPLLAFTKQHKTYVQTILPLAKRARVANFIYITPPHTPCPTDTKRAGGRHGYLVRWVIWRGRGADMGAPARRVREVRAARCVPRRAPPGLAELPPTSEWTSRRRGRGSPICCSWWMMTTVGTCGLGSGPLQPAARSTTLSACCLLSHDSSVRKA